MPKSGGGHPLLPLQTVQAILDAPEGESQKRIADRLRISEPTVRSVLKNPRYYLSKARDKQFSRMEGKAKRCPGCGNLCFAWPCLTCQIDYPNTLRNLTYGQS